MSEDALSNGLSRVLASMITWPVEKSKLLYQAGVNNSPSGVWRDLTRLDMKIHIMGMSSSGCQRGGSAFIMFALQSQAYRLTHQATSSSPMNHALAGTLAGAMSAPFHTYWEIIKVRHELPCRRLYLTCLQPMILRHAVFDGTFFGVNALLLSEHQYTTGIRFAAAAASASLMNLVFDVWKTRQMAHFPHNVSLRQVFQSMTRRVFLTNYLVKGTDLALNWFVVGCLKEFLFD